MMRDLSAQKLGVIKSAITDKINSLKKKFDPAVGSFIVNLALINYEEGGEVLICFDNEDALTDKDFKLIRKQVEELVATRFGTKIKAKVLSQNRKFGEQVPEQEFRKKIEEAVVPMCMTESQFFQIYYSIYSVQLEESRKSKEQPIADLMTEYFDRKKPVNLQKVLRVFIELLWPNIREAAARYPAIVDLQLLNVASALDYTRALAEDLHKRYLVHAELLKKIQVEHPLLIELFSGEVVGEYKTPKLTPKAIEFLNSSSDEKFVEKLKRFSSEILRISRLVTESSHEDNELKMQAFDATRLMESFIAYHGYVQEQSLVIEFKKLFGSAWYFGYKNDEENIFLRCKKHLYDSLLNSELIRKKLELLGPILVLFAKEMAKKIESLEHDIMVEKARQAELKKEKIKERKLLFKETPVVDEGRDTKLLMKLSALNFSENETLESRAIAAQKEQREKYKSDVKRSRVFDTSRGATLHAPVVEIANPMSNLDFMLKVASLKTDSEIEIDIFEPSRHTLESPYFHLADNQYLLILEDILTLNRTQRRLLLNNAGRGFIGAVSPGQTGIKYFREGYVALKGNDEVRVLCAKKELWIDAASKIIEFFIPVEAIDNHEEYEKALNTPKLAEKLRSQLDNACLIEVVEQPTSHQSPKP